ncbi:hypothetical protein THAOC_30929 [Thalassiosira oceanica]|uniref:RxLR effector protein n=1 Tax=Thalassiosira oceanica TaxID=159749 RepID=K0RAC5_THAOC|nr:hypothetical protein THAOC_30929 [Thalassiosira oceanica]|eukprot:EJK50130.1 hypothetical protein THAOC_30929 [Thalassiosira oceanica]
MRFHTAAAVFAAIHCTSTTAFVPSRRAHAPSSATALGAKTVSFKEDSRKKLVSGDQPGRERGQGHPRPQGAERRPRAELRRARDRQRRSHDRERDQPGGPRGERGRAPRAGGGEQVRQQGGGRHDDQHDHDPGHREQRDEGRDFGGEPHRAQCGD